MQPAEVVEVGKIMRFKRYLGRISVSPRQVGLSWLGNLVGVNTLGQISCFHAIKPYDSRSEDSLMKNLCLGIYPENNLHCINIIQSMTSVKKRRRVQIPYLMHLFSYGYCLKN